MGSHSQKVLTPLMRVALTFNSLIQTKLFHYAQPFQWDDASGKFIHPKSRLKLLPWLFVNFFLLPWVAVVNSVVVLTSYKLNLYGPLNILQIFILMVQALLVVSILATSCTFYLKSDGLVSFFNFLFRFRPRTSSSVNYVKSLRDMMRMLFRSNWSFLYLEDGSVDLFGALVTGTVGSFLFFYLPLPPFVFLFDLDAPYHFFRIVLPTSWYTPWWGRALIQLVRIFIGTWCMYEGLTMVRIVVVYIMLLLWVYKIQLTLLAKEAVTMARITCYRILYIYFALLNESLCIMTPVYLSVIYIVFIFLNTVSILGMNVKDWMFYLSVPLVGVVGLFSLVMIWNMSTLVDHHSRLLKFQWVLSVAEITRARSVPRSYKMLLRKSVRSIRPISMSYGTMGTMKASTRRQYLFSLMNDSMQLIILLKARGLFKVMRK